MKNYITTNNHPELKEGVKIDSKNRLLFIEDVSFNLLPETIELWIENGYIKEIQEPEFTQREMKDRCVKFLQNHSGHSLNRSIEIYDNWIKGKE